MPRIRWRVVCGFAVQIDRRNRIKLLTRVDLPTLGRPTTTMYPALKVDFSLVAHRWFCFRRSEKKALPSSRAGKGSGALIVNAAFLVLDDLFAFQRNESQVGSSASESRSLTPSANLSR